MAAFRRRTVVPAHQLINQQRTRFDLPVDPLSALVLNFRWLSPNHTLVPWRMWATPLELYGRVRVSHRGVSILDASLGDLAMMSALAARWPPWQRDRVYATLGENQVSIPLVFGRKPYAPEEALPATKRGDLVLDLEQGDFSSTSDIPRLSIDAIELPGAEPKRYLRTTHHHLEPFDNNDSIYKLPNNATLLGVLLFDEAPIGNNQLSASFQDIRLLVDNKETHYHSINWDAAHAELMRAHQAAFVLEEHLHATNNTSEAAPLSEQQTSPISNTVFLKHYAWLDLDPTGDGLYALDTRPHKDVEIRTRPNLNLAFLTKVISLELVTVGGAAP